ncbi:MAG: DUF2442 domain-containing protein [Candidatus Aminicenantes bacterium]|nr:DUF2442 domain-containing protein [Candidatus Aminicenantes bacterium]
MRISVIDRQEIKAKNIRFDKERMYVSLTDGREIGVPLEWFPKLRSATARQKKNWRLIGGGKGIHWMDLDEDLSVPALLK